jgi:ubiquinone/menaquinone biosynthesis C-methylase UbiE
MSTNEQAGWDGFARTNASDRFRRQSAAMGTPLTDLVVREAAIEPGMRVLDVASGTGEPAISIASVMNGTGEVIASDVSEQPLKIGAERAAKRRLTNISFRVADVHRLPFADGYFDRVTCRLGLMFFADVEKALRDIHRVLKPGGRFTAVAWGHMEQPYFQRTIGTVLKICPELKLPSSSLAMFKFAQRGTLTRLLLDAGFATANDELRDVDWTWQGTPEELWDYFQAVTIPFEPLLNAIPKMELRKVDEAVIASIGTIATREQIDFGGRFVLAQGLR